MKHGTNRSYVHERCRCDVCRAWKRAKNRAELPVLRGRVAAKDPSLVHGTAALYCKGGCRCEPCCAANTEREKKYRERHPDRHSDYMEKWREAQIRKAGTPHHWGYQWTGPELEFVATRTDLTATELATMLGRTPSAVQGARSRVRTDPKWAQVAGVSEDA